MLGAPFLLERCLAWLEARCWMIALRRIARRAAHFGEATLSADVNDVISHRRRLERMLAGEYW